MGIERCGVAGKQSLSGTCQQIAISVVKHELHLDRALGVEQSDKNCDDACGLPSSEACRAA
jgi:hypothetical protein